MSSQSLGNKLLESIGFKYVEGKNGKPGEWRRTKIARLLAAAHLKD